jgi:gamma-F420-2:alpha-L-glutamate ligase
MVAALQTKFAFDFVGVDFIRDEGKWILNEIEDVVGSRMLYKTANIDVADLYLKHVAKSIAAAQG